MTFTIRRSILVVVVSLLVIAAGVFVSQRASAASATPVVYVATGENFPDALGAASAAAVQGGPVLLVQKDSIPAETAAELSRLNPSVIYVAGGTAVVPDAVFNQLKAYAGNVVRVAGANRYATAVEVSKSAFPATGAGTAALEARIAALEALLAGVTRNSDTLLFDGMNLQVVNGAGTTESKNTLGNVIIGYNEWTQGGTPFRGGSHYLVVGPDHQYRSWGGIVAGQRNTASGAYASVAGGRYGTASGDYSSVCGGFRGVAAGESSTVSGGWGNYASGVASTVSGGAGNTATGSGAAVSGGEENAASGPNASVTGGFRNEASGLASSVSGGSDNTASFGESSVTGGYNNTASGATSSVSGGSDNTAIGQSSSVSGGTNNLASGALASVSGGGYNAAMGDRSSILGSQSMQIWGDYSYWPQ